MLCRLVQLYQKFVRIFCLFYSFLLKIDAASVSETLGYGSETPVCHIINFLILWISWLWLHIVFSLVSVLEWRHRVADNLSSFASFMS